MYQNGSFVLSSTFDNDNSILPSPLGSLQHYHVLINFSFCAGNNRHFSSHQGYVKCYVDNIPSSMPNKATCGNISCVHLFAPPHNKLYLSRPFLGTAHTQQNGFLRYQRFSCYGLTHTARKQNRCKERVWYNKIQWFPA